MGRDGSKSDGTPETLLIMFSEESTMVALTCSAETKAEWREAKAEMPKRAKEVENFMVVNEEEDLFRNWRKVAWKSFDLQVLFGFRQNEFYDLLSR